MKYGYLFLLFITNAHMLICMERPRPSSKISSSGESTLSPFEELPADLQLKIMILLSDSPTLAKAINGIKSLARTSRHFRDFLKDQQTVYEILKNLEKRFYQSMLEIALIMNTPTSREIAENLRKKAQKYQATENNFYNYADSLLKITNPQDKKEITSYLYYLDLFPANRAGILQAILKTVADNNFEQFKVWMESGYFKKFPAEILKQILENTRVVFLKYLIEHRFDVKNVQIKSRSGSAYLPAEYLEEVVWYLDVSPQLISEMLNLLE